MFFLFIPPSPALSVSLAIITTTFDWVIHIGVTTTIAGVVVDVVTSVVVVVVVGLVVVCVVVGMVLHSCLLFFVALEGGHKGGWRVTHTHVDWSDEVHVHSNEALKEGTSFLWLVFERIRSGVMLMMYKRFCY